MKNKTLISLLMVLIITSINTFAQNVGISSGVITPNTRLDVDGDIALREGTPINLANGANSDIAIGNYSFYRITGPAGAFSITGLAGGQNGKMVTLYNTTTQVMTIVNDATSAAANRIYTLTGANVVTPAGPNIITLQYNSTVQRWLLVSGQNISTSGGGGAHVMTSADHSAGNWKLFYSDATGAVKELGIGASGEVLTSAGAATAPAWTAISNAHTMTSTDHSAGPWKLFYSDAAGDVKELGIGASGDVLTSAGASAIPTWTTIVGGGGTHAMTSADHTAGNWKLFYSNGSGDVTELGLGASGDVLTSSGAAAAPAWTTIVGGGGAHAMTSADHTAGNWKLFYSNGSGDVTELGLGASGDVLTSSGANVAPAWSTPASSVPISRTITLDEVTNETSVIGGAQNLSANRTWTIGLADNAIFPGIGAVTVPASITANRPAAPTNGMIRYNTTTSKFEFYQNGAWTNFVGTLNDAYDFGGAAGSGNGRQINVTTLAKEVLINCTAVGTDVANIAKGLKITTNQNFSAGLWAEQSANGVAIVAKNTLATCNYATIQTTTVSNDTTTGALVAVSTGKAPAIQAMVDAASVTTKYAILGINKNVVGGFGVFGTGVQGVYGNGSHFGVAGEANDAGVWGHGGTNGVYGLGNMYSIYGEVPVDVVNGWSGYFNDYIFVQNDIWSSGSGSIQTSDIRLKENIEAISSPLNTIMQIDGKKYSKLSKRQSMFESINDSTFVESDTPLETRHTEYGVIAQDLETILPDLVSSRVLYKNDTTAYKGVNYTGLIPILIEAMKEQQTMIINLQSEVGTLRDELNALKK